LWDSEVFCEAARVDVTLLELVAECEVALGTVLTMVAGDVVMGDNSIAYLVSSDVTRDSFDGAADFVSENASWSKLAFYLFQVCSADAARLHPDEDVACR
jgi:hypothetical protein